ncbi:hypothetical protein JVU11DRAFT_6295 [Chiua virens]|nr:hypothetical protein JVU11DRAFT_6295 [Chiua virens]
MQYLAASRINEHGRLQEVTSGIHELRAYITHGRTELSHSNLVSVTLIDASGREHIIPKEYTTSLEQFQIMLGVIFRGTFPGVRIQKQYFEAGKYDLCIDQGTQVVQLTSNATEWPSH